MSGSLFLRHSVHLYRVRRDLKCWICRWNFDAVIITAIINTSGFGGIITVFGCLSSSKLLSLKSPLSILSGSQLKINKFNVFPSERLGAFYPLSATDVHKNISLKAVSHN